MAGNAWKYSGVLDDYDLAFLQRDFITIRQGVEYYGFSERPFIRMAKEAGAFYKIGKMVRINRANSGSHSVCFHDGGVGAEAAGN